MYHPPVAHVILSDVMSVTTSGSPLYSVALCSTVPLKVGGLADFGDTHGISYGEIPSRMHGRVGQTPFLVSFKWDKCSYLAKQLKLADSD